MGKEKSSKKDRKDKKRKRDKEDEEEYRKSKAEKLVSLQVQSCCCAIVFPALASDIVACSQLCCSGPVLIARCTIM